MFIEFKMLLRKLVLPPTSLLLVGLIGVALGERRIALGRLLVVASLLGLWSLATPVVGFGIYRMAEGYRALGDNESTTAGAIVLLGGGGFSTFSPEWGGATMTDVG